MNPDVYVCYDDKDKEIAEEVYSALKNRKLKCWMKSHDVHHDEVKEMMEAIDKSHVMVLIYSMHSKASNFVNTEVDVAFSKKIPIMVFRTDDSEIDGALEFFISSQPKFNAFEDSDRELKLLIEKTVRVVRDTKKGNVADFVKDKKIPIAICLAIILIAGACIYMFVPWDDMNNEGPADLLDAGNVTLKVTDFHVDDVHKKGYAWNYSYFVGGTFSPVPARGGGYVVTSDFYDKSGNLVNSTTTPFDQLQIVDDGFLLGSTVRDANDIARVEVQLLTSKDMVVAHSDSQLKNIK